MNFFMLGILIGMKFIVVFIARGWNASSVTTQRLFSNAGELAAVRLFVPDHLTFLFNRASVLAALVQGPRPVLD